MTTPLEQFLATLPTVRAQLDERLDVCLDAHQVAWTLCEFAGRELALDDCVVYLSEVDGHALVQRAAWGPKRVAERLFDGSIRLDFGQGVVGTCALIGATQLVPDTRLDPRYVLDDAKRLAELAVPIMAKGRVLGVIDCEHAVADYFDSRHIRALLAIAGCGADRLQTLGG